MPLDTTLGGAEECAVRVGPGRGARDVSRIGSRRGSHDGHPKLWLARDVTPRNTVEGRRHARSSRRRLFQSEAPAFADAGYIVFSADYRLACKPTDVPAPTVDEAPLCGWQWPTVDPQTGLANAAMQDVLDAVQWVRGNAATYWSGFNTKVAAVGGSSGGNLLYRGVMGLSSGDTHIPEVAGGWSGNVYFSRILGDIGNGQPYFCDDAPAGDQAGCWQVVIRYLTCDIRTVAPSCVDIYHDAEPINFVGFFAPDTYIANSAIELVNVWNQTDLAQSLTDRFVDSRSCTPPGDAHGRAYVLTGHCANLPGNPVVIDDQLAWFQPYVFP